MKREDGAMACPRCESRNTKFCYYNNYSKSQPRHYCRSCKRYWTAGGSLRNVPSGGRTVKKRRGQTSSKSKSMTSHTSKRSGSWNGNTSVAIVISGEALGKKIDTQLVDQQKDESFGGISPGFDQKDESFGGVSAAFDQKDESFGGISPRFDQKDESSGGVSAAFDQKDESFGGISPRFDQKDESSGGVSAGFDQKDESFGGVSPGFDQKDESLEGVSPGSDQKDVTDILYKNHGLSECYDLLTDEIGEGVMACSSYQSLFDHEVFSFELPEVSDLINTGKNGDEYQQHQWQWQLPSTSDIVGKEMRWEDHFHDSLCVTDFLTMDVPQFSK